jgi:YrbI family 3-deoxy-D-manno-octulosonate 8-phosphate phosphatase
VDSCLTDGSVYYFDNGQRARKFSTVDGHGIQLLKENGIFVVLLSGEDDPNIYHRADKLEVPFFSTKNKLKTALQYILKLDWEPEKIIAFGDDLPDLPLLEYADFAGCPSNAQKEVRNLIYEKIDEKKGCLCDKRGGKGAFREFSILFAALPKPH